MNKMWCAVLFSVMTAKCSVHTVGTYPSTNKATSTKYKHCVSIMG